MIGRFMTRLEKFCLVSSLPMREISEFSKLLSALKGLTYARFDFMAIELNGPGFAPEFSVVFDFEL